MKQLPSYEDQPACRKTIMTQRREINSAQAEFFCFIFAYLIAYIFIA